jgi:hypothetical protein
MNFLTSRTSVLENLFDVKSNRYVFRGNLEVRGFKGHIASCIPTKRTEQV